MAMGLPVVSTRLGVEDLPITADEHYLQADTADAFSADIALRLSRVLGMSPDFWLGLQQDWDLWHIMHSPEAEQINGLKPITLDPHPFA